MFIGMRGALVKRRGSASRCASFMVATALTTPAQQHQIARDDLSTIFLFSALLIFPARGLEAALNIDFGSFLHVLANNLSQPLPGHYVVPLRAVLPLAAF